MRMSRIFPMLIASLSGTIGGGLKELKILSKAQRSSRSIVSANLQSTNGGSFGNTTRGWRKAQSVSAHREIQRLKRRNT